MTGATHRPLPPKGGEGRGEGGIAAFPAPLTQPSPPCGWRGLAPLAEPTP